MHILEDDPGVSDSLLTFLKGLGYEACTYPDAESFLESAPPSPEDTIIVDLLLPGISGARVIEWLQTMKTPPRVIAITGQPQAAIEKQIHGLRNIQVLRKPLSAETIASMM
ncbi:response regulator [Alsobacter soli]|uniref:Response regulator n=1 Tax=Alsobacter soli TaxID=2109933 RepID=A0A2T1HYQ7_9HYPH|nr:response regulator [Alsobacter soli]